MGVVTHVQAHDAQQLLDVLDRTPVPRLALTSPLLESAEAALWEGRLNGLFDDCGCDTGAVGFVSGLAVSFALVRRREPPLSPVAAMGVLVAAVIAAALGKLLGQRARRRRARREGLVLAATIAARELAHGSRVKGSTS